MRQIHVIPFYRGFPWFRTFAGVDVTFPFHRISRASALPVSALFLQQYFTFHFLWFNFMSQTNKLIRNLTNQLLTFFGSHFLFSPAYLCIRVQDPPYYARSYVYPVSPNNTFKYIITALNSSYFSKPSVFSVNCQLSCVGLLRNVPQTWEKGPTTSSVYKIN